MNLVFMGIPMIKPMALNMSYTHTNTHTLTHTQSKQSQSKAYGSHAKHSYCCPVDQHWDACAPFRHLSLVQANPLGAGQEHPQEDYPSLMERGRRT